MAKIGRPGLSREKRVELWARWKSGQCGSDIARALERTKGAIHHVLAFNGGIPPVARRRSPVALMLDEREEISRGIAAGQSISGIAAGLGRSPSTVSREVTRHGGRESYRATEADARAWELALRPSRVASPAIPSRWRVIEKLALDWSPEPQGLHDRHRRAGLFLRSAKSVAARQQRKHQRIVASVLPQRHRSLGLLSVVLEQDRVAPKPTSPKNLGICNACR